MENTDMENTDMENTDMENDVESRQVFSFRCSLQYPEKTEINNLNLAHSLYFFISSIQQLDYYTICITICR